MRRLWYRLFGPKKAPVLVIPEPGEEAADDHFLWGCERIEVIRFGENLILPVE